MSLFIYFIFFLGICASESDLNNSFSVFQTDNFAAKTSSRLFQNLNGTQCGRDLIFAVLSAVRKEAWAVKMIGGSMKLTNFLISDGAYQIEGFDECVGAGGPLRSQYCLFSLNQTKNVGESRYELGKISWGACVPASCQLPELKLLFEGFLISIDETFCYREQASFYAPLEIIFAAFILFYLIFTVVATACHFFLSKVGKSPILRILFCFSLIKNVRNFLSIKSSGLNLQCVCGIRFISMIFIIAGHCFLFVIGGPVENPDFFEKQSHNFFNAIFINSPLLVDSFLLISGFLMTYLLLTELDKRNGKINILGLYLARYIRLTPAYLVVLAFYSTWFVRIGEGPFWMSKIELEKDRCLKSWWVNLLYVNNYINTNHICMFQSWYLAADFHLFILAPLLIYPMWRWPKLGKIILGISVTTTVILTFLVTFIHHLDPTLMIFPREVFDINDNFYFKNYYIKTHMRAGSYLIGVLFGFILYKIQKNGAKFSKMVLVFGWILSGVLGLTSLFSVIYFYDLPDVGNIVKSFYACLHRPAWCLSIGWILLICITKQSTLVNGFLSWKPFIVLSRLTYCAYLINGVVELYSFGTLRQPTYLSKFDLATKALAHIIMTFVFGFFLCIFFESPIYGIEKIILKRDNKVGKSDTTT